MRLTMREIDAAIYPNYQAYNDEYRLTLSEEESRLLLANECEEYINMANYVVSWEVGDKLIDDYFSCEVPEPLAAAPDGNDATGPSVVLTKAREALNSLQRSGSRSNAGASDGRKRPPPIHVRRSVSPGRAEDGDGMEGARAGRRADRLSSLSESACLARAMGRLQLAESSSFPADILRPREEAEKTDDDQRKKDVPDALRKEATRRWAVNETKERIRLRTAKEEKGRSAAWLRKQKILQKQAEIAEMRKRIEEAKEMMKAMLETDDEDDDSVTALGGVEEPPSDADDESRSKKRSRHEGFNMNPSDKDADEVKRQELSRLQKQKRRRVLNPTSKPIHAVDDDSEKFRAIKEQREHQSYWFAVAPDEPPSTPQPSPIEPIPFPKLSHPSTKATKTILANIRIDSNSDTQMSKQPDGTAESPVIMSSPSEEEKDIASRALNPQPATLGKRPLIRQEAATRPRPEPFILPTRAFYRTKKVVELRKMSSARGLGTLGWAKKEKIITEILEWDEENPEEAISFQLENGAKPPSQTQVKNPSAPLNGRSDGMSGIESPHSSSSAAQLPRNPETEHSKADTSPVNGEHSTSTGTISNPTTSQLPETGQKLPMVGTLYVTSQRPATGEHSTSTGTFSNPTTSQLPATGPKCSKIPKQPKRPAPLKHIPRANNLSNPASPSRPAVFKSNLTLDSFSSPASPTPAATFNRNLIENNLAGPTSPVRPLIWEPHLGVPPFGSPSPTSKTPSRRRKPVAIDMHATESERDESPSPTMSKRRKLSKNPATVAGEEDDEDQELNG